MVNKKVRANRFPGSLAVFLKTASLRRRLRPASVWRRLRGGKISRRQPDPFGFFRIMPTIQEILCDLRGQPTRGEAPSTSTGSVQAPRVLAFPRQPQTFLSATSCTLLFGTVRQNTQNEDFCIEAAEAL